MCFVKIHQLIQYPMIMLLLLYLIPAICNILSFKESFEILLSMKKSDEQTSAILAYAILCACPVLNLLVFIYTINFYVCEIFRKN